MFRKIISFLYTFSLSRTFFHLYLTNLLTLPRKQSFLALFRDDYDEYLDYNYHVLGCLMVWEVLGKDVQDEEPVKEMVADQVSPAMGQEA